ncbi:hypothetical protein [Microvirga sp. 2TAF3]|uniref:hypothetical protein n=1 Tax=Microvirga sp. 2TAF3 TaxID=3233014 RepID=UPI003F96A214
MNRYEQEVKEKDLNEQIAKSLAEKRGLNWGHRGSRDLCLSAAYDIVSAWSKNPREPQTEIERLCQAIMDVRQAFAKALAERQATWAAMRAARDGKLKPESEPFTVLTLRDETSGRRIKLTVPTDTVLLL